MRIIGWTATVTITCWSWGIPRIREMAWRPVFALPRPQLILDTLLNQIIGKLRRCRLMSESNKLQPY